MWRIVLGTAGFVVPVTITTLDLFGYIARVEGASMQPCLNPDLVKNNPKVAHDNDYVYLNRWTVRDYKFKRGEIVSLTSPHNPEQKIIKRIIALDGDKVKTLSYKQRYVNIPRGHCWVEGDHHGQSLDSNFFGPVAIGLINSKASHIVWPPSRWQRLPVIENTDRVEVRSVQHCPHLFGATLKKHEDSHVNNNECNSSLEKVDTVKAEALHR